MNTSHSSGKTLREIISSSPICILYAHRGRVSKFNEYLRQQFKDNYISQVATARMDLSNINYRNSEIISFVKSWIPSIGLPPTSSIYPGYYLFQNGILIGYHSGIIDPSQLDARAEGILTLLNVLGAALVGIIEKNARKGAETFLEGMVAINGMRIFRHFQKLLKTEESNKTHAKHQNTSEQALNNAYKLLGVTPGSTDIEVTKAWRKLVNQHHPDRCTDKKEQESMTRRTIEINKAYDMIKNARSKRKKQGHVV